MCTTRMYATLQPPRRHEQFVSSKKIYALYCNANLRLASTDSNVYYAHVRDAATSTTPRAVGEFQKNLCPILQCYSQASVILISVIWQNDDGGMGDDASDALTRFSCFQCCCCVSTYSTLCALMFCFFIPWVCFNVTYLCMSPVSTFWRVCTWHALACIHI